MSDQAHPEGVDRALTVPRRMIVAISGSTGAVYGVRLLEVLREFFPAVERHVILTNAARVTIDYELEMDPEDAAEMATVLYDEKNIGAAIASGTYLTQGMVIAPCSMRTLSGVANSWSDTLVTRAADVCLKERRPLALVVRETPLHLGHLKLMVRVTEAGGFIVPPVPAFYHRPQNIQDIVDHSVVKVLDLLGLNTDGLISRWTGL
jgi:4-hydroxy-3-polyprenylbenzoate decarboxylase